MMLCTLITVKSRLHPQGLQVSLMTHYTPQLPLRIFENFSSYNKAKYEKQVRLFEDYVLLYKLADLVFHLALLY